MTSKEALEELEAVLKSNIGTMRYADIFIENLLKPIEKDLEILNTLKKYCVDIETVGMMPDYNTYKALEEGVRRNENLILPEEDFIKIKEWLKDE